MNARASPSVHRSFRIDASIFSRATGTLAVRRQPSRFFARVVSSSSRVTLIPARGTLATGRRRRRKRIATSRAHPWSDRSTRSKTMNIVVRSRASVRASSARVGGGGRKIRPCGKVRPRTPRRFDSGRASRGGRRRTVYPYTRSV